VCGNWSKREGRRKRGILRKRAPVCGRTNVPSDRTFEEQIKKEGASK